MKICDDNLLLFLDNLKTSLYTLIWTDNQFDYDFYKWDITERIKFIFLYKQKLLKEFLKIKNMKEDVKNES